MKAPLRSTESSWSRVLVIGALLLLALALRLYLLDHQSLWADEGNSVAMAPRAPLDILQRTANDIHPPLYYLLLHYWAGLVGTPVFAVRALSALCGVAAIALIYAIARRLGAGKLSAVIAALLLTISPFAIHYSQETRMYMLVMTLGAASWLAWLRWNRVRLDRRATGYFLLTLALLYSHYYAVSLVVAQNIAWLFTLMRDKEVRGRGAGWLVAQTALALGFLPWLWYARDTILNWPATSAPVTLTFMVGEIARIFTLGLANEGLPAWVAVFIVIVLLAGVVGAVRLRYGFVALLYFIVPPALMLLLSLDRPFWNPKFLLLALPGFALLCAVGASRLLAWTTQLWRAEHQRLVQAVGAALLLVLIGAATYPALHNEYHNPRYARDDYKGIARTILAQAGAQDAILLDGAGQREIFSYYYDGEMPVFGLPDRQPLDLQHTESTLADIASNYEQIWVVWWAEEEGDPELVIPRWLQRNAFAAESRWFGNVRLERYTTSAPPLMPVGALGKEFEQPFRLPESSMGFAINAVGVGPTPLTAGQVVAVYAEGSAITSAADVGDVTFFAQLLDAADHVIGQYDGDAGAPPMRAWAAGERYALRMGVPVPVGTIAGDYRLIIGAYDPTTGLRFTAPFGDSLPVGTVQVDAPPVPPSVDAIPLPQDRFHDAPFGSLALVAAQVNKVGADHAPATPLRPGEPLSLLLFWQIRSAAPVLPVVDVTLVDAEGVKHGTWAISATENRFPIEQWRVGELIRDPHTLFTQGNLVSGRYQIEVGDVIVGDVIVAP